MLTKRIIPCLDVKDGRTVKGVNFTQLRDAGNPVELGSIYAQAGADELCFLDISASLEKRKTFARLVNEIARYVDIPFTVGGGIGSTGEVEVLLNSGADKISINSAAVQNPGLIDELAANFGSQCVVVAIDARLTSKGWKVHTHGGTRATEFDVLEWSREVFNRGAGEILLTSMEHDGTKSGFALELTRSVSEALTIPVIASGGAGSMQHFADVFQQGKADAALAAGLFHFKELEIATLKQFLKTQRIEVRM